VLEGALELGVAGRFGGAAAQAQRQGGDEPLAAPGALEVAVAIGEAARCGVEGARGGVLDAEGGEGAERVGELLPVGADVL
jgi:hypothetical protein